MHFIGPRKKANLLFRLLRFFTIFCGINLLTIAMGYSSFPLIGKWLVRVDTVQESGAIAVLAGSLPTRAMEAAELYHSGYAKEIWLTHPNGQKNFSDYPDIHEASEDEFNVQVLLGQGVPAEAIRVLDTPIVNTADELNAIASELKRTGDDTVIVVTSKAHTRRVHSLWKKYHSGDGKIIVHAVTGDAFDPSRWWKTSGGKTQVFHELLGMINLWAGLPIQPALHPYESLASNQFLATR